MKLHFFPLSPHIYNCASRNVTVLHEKKCNINDKFINL